MAAKVNILGDGLAACCAAQLLLRQGFSLSVSRTNRPRPARLLISEQTQSLLREIFGSSDLFNDAPQIRRRVVRWGSNAETVELPHRGLVASEQALLDALWKRTGRDDPASSPDEASQSAWTVVSTPGFDSLPPLQSFGSRHAVTVSVDLDRNAVRDCCWVEAVQDGWLFLLPAGDGRATLISAGFAPEGLVEQSTLIAPLISNFDPDVDTPRSFPAFPQVLTSMSGPHWLACGSAAMTFDPLCGEGAGNAAREALLASAVIQAAAKGYAAESLLSHYSTRLMQGFLRHLQVCLPFYRSGGSGPFWTTETESLQRGILWTQERLRGHAPFVYRLVGYELEPILVKEQARQ